MDCSFGGAVTSCNIVFMSNYEQVSIPKLNFSDSYNYKGIIRFPKANLDSLYECMTGLKNYNKPITIPGCVYNCEFLFHECNNFSSKVIIENGVTNCGSMFRNCADYNRPVSFPKSVRKVSSAFWGCSNFNSPVTFDNNGYLKSAMFLFRDTKFNQNLWMPDWTQYSRLENAFDNCPYKCTLNVSNTAISAVSAFNTQNIAYTHAPFGPDLHTGDVTGFGLIPSENTLGCKVIDREHDAVFEIVMDTYDFRTWHEPIWICTKPGTLERM